MTLMRRKSRRRGCFWFGRIAGWCPSSRRHSTSMKRSSPGQLRGELSYQFYLRSNEECCGLTRTIWCDWFLRLQEMTANNQAMEDLKEQVGLKRLCATCDQVWINQDSFLYVILNTSVLVKWKNTGTPTVEVEKSCVYSMLSSQDVEFASRLVKQSQVSAEVLLEALRLLLPTLPESELLSITDALCPKQHTASSSVEQEHSG